MSAQPDRILSDNPREAADSAFCNAEEAFSRSDEPMGQSFTLTAICYYLRSIDDRLRAMGGG